MLRECLFCGEKFIPVKGNQKYCYREHLKLAYRKLKVCVLKCKICGKKIPLDSKNRTMYCSYECYHKAMLEKWKKYNKKYTKLK